MQFFVLIQGGDDPPKILEEIPRLEAPLPKAATARASHHRCGPSTHPMQQRATWADRRQVEAAQRRQAFLVARQERLRASQSRSRGQDGVSTLAQRDDAVILIQTSWYRRRLSMMTQVFLHTDITRVARGGDFEKMKAAMMERRTIQAAETMIRRMTACNPIATALTHPQRSGRIMLTALLLRHFGEQVMPHPTDEEKRVLDVALAFSLALEGFFHIPCRRLLCDVAAAWSVFHTTFSAWQSQSRTELIQTMQQDYLCLHQLEASLGPEAKQEWVPHIRKHQKRLRAALQRVGGSSAVPCLDVPNDVEPVAKPTGKVPSDTEFAATLGNIQIAHDLMVDPSFDFQKLMALKTGREYSSSMTTSVEIADGNVQTFVEFVLMVKHQLLDMLVEQKGLAAEIRENLDEPLLFEQVENNAVDPVAILKFLLRCAAKMCAPIRDSQVSDVEAMLDSTDVSVACACEALGRLLVAMHEDLGNFGLCQVRPHLEQQIVAYERDWFARNLHVCDRAREMSIGIYERMCDEWRDKKPLQVIHAVIAESILLLLGFPHDRLSSLAPRYKIASHELLVLDHHRMLRIAGQLGNIVRLSALVLVLKGLGHEAETLEVADVCDSAHIDRRLLLSRISALPSVSTSELGAIEAACNRIVDNNDPVVTLLHRRVAAVVRTSLLEPTAPSSLALLHKHGIAKTLSARFATLETEIRRMFQLHRDVLAPLYNKFIHDEKN